MSNFKFEFSLEILNHLGRGLYRSFATVIAEAISNSWDAEATEVKINFNKDSNILSIEDNGKGMGADDFQNKFLKVGYSRRKDEANKSKRTVIGRKGIGKLALLSVSEKITIVSKKSEKDITGGIINNQILDEKIEQDGKYSLENLEEENKNLENGTKIIFEGLKTNFNQPETIKRYIAVQFNFIFNLKNDDRFDILVNSEKVSPDDLKGLNEKTQFIWFLGAENADIKNRFSNLKNHKIIEDNKFEFESKNIEIKGFIASVTIPSSLKLRRSGEDFQASINLFCNGRLRQEDLFKEIKLNRIPEDYLYGEIYVDSFEDEKIDRFTSSREGIIKNDPLYIEFIKKLKEIQNIIVNQDWDKWRRETKARWGS